jgi:DNA-binding response OmpR family regulator
MPHVALVEDETSLNELIKLNLELDGHSVISFINASRAYSPVDNSESPRLLTRSIIEIGRAHV